MKPITHLSFTILAFLMLAGGMQIQAQQYKLRQTTGMTGMQSESTIYVKGMRKRTEGAGYMGMGANLVTIEQCDLQRTIKINTKKKLYYVAPFATEATEEQAKPAAAKYSGNKADTNGKNTSRKGGIIHSWYNITDTGERKKMYGFTARHVWTTQKIKPSADACMMKDSMLVKTDGWYIDLPQFTCPNIGYGQNSSGGGFRQPDCNDQFISKRTGKGKLGFPLTETRTMIMGGAKTTEFTSTMETLEFTTVELDSMLFEIPVGYSLTEKEEDLQDTQPDMSQYIQQAAANKGGGNGQAANQSAQKKAGAIRIGVFVPKGDEQLALAEIQSYLVNILSDGNVEAVAISSEADAKKYQCDLLLNTEFTRVKQGSKVGSFLKAIKNTDPSATSSFNIEAGMVLSNVTDGAIRADEKISGKYDGKLKDAAMRAMEKGCRQLVDKLD